MQPGPLWAKLTDAYSAYHSYRGDMHLDVQKCHETYGLDARSFAQSSNPDKWIKERSFVMARID